MGYSEACGVSAVSNDSIIATGGINNKGDIGYWNSLFYAKDGFKFTSVSQEKDKAVWDAAVAAGNLVFIGDGKFEDQSTEASFFEDAALNIKKVQTPKIKSVRFITAVCGCTSAQLEKLEGKAGGLLIQTSTNLVLGRQDGLEITPLKVSSFSVDDTIPTNDTPVRYTNIDITFSDGKGDRANPHEANVDFLFNEVEQVYEAGGTSSASSTDGSTFTTTINMTKGCSSEGLTAAVQANFKAYDVDGNELTIASFNASSAAYTFGVTTALTTIRISTDGIVAIGGTSYVMDNVTATTV